MVVDMVDGAVDAVDDLHRDDGIQILGVPIFFARRGDASQSLTLDWSTEDGTATAGSDYVAASGQVVFGVGVTQQTVSIVVNGDAVGEADETLYLNLLVASGSATVADAKSQATLQNDDVTPDPTVDSLSDSPDPVKQGQTLTLTATVDAGTGGSTITNTAAVTASDQTDSNPANDTDSADLTVQSIDLAVTKTVDNATPNEGATVSYTVTLTNKERPTAALMANAIGAGNPNRAKHALAASMQVSIVTSVVLSAAVPVAWGRPRARGSRG